MLTRSSRSSPQALLVSRNITLRLSDHLTAIHGWEASGRQGGHAARDHAEEELERVLLGHLAQAKPHE